MSDRSKTFYGTGKPDPARGTMEGLTPDPKVGEMAETYARTKREAEKKAFDARIKSNMSTETFKLDPLSKALNQVVK